MTKTEFINSLAKAAEEAAKYFKKEKLISNSDLLPKSKDLGSRDYKLGLITDFDADDVDFYEEEKITLSLYKNGNDHTLYGCFYADRESLGKPKFTKLITNYLVYILHKDLDKYKNIRTICISVDGYGEGLEDLEIRLAIAAKLSKHIKVERQLQALEDHTSFRYVFLDDVLGDSVGCTNVMLDSVMLQFDTTKKKTTKNDRSGVSKKVRNPK